MSMVHAYEDDKIQSFQSKAWISLLLVWSFYLFEYILRVTPSVITYDLMTDFGVSAAALGGLSSIYYLAYVPLQFLCGVIVDRFGPRRVVSLSAFLCVIGSALFCSSDFFSMSAFGRFLMGAGSACAYLCCGKVASEWYSMGRFSLIMGLTMMMGTLGGVFGGKPFATLVMAVGWRHAFLVMVILGLVISVLCWFGVKDKPVSVKAKAALSTQDDVSFFDGIKTITKSSQQWMIGLYGCMMYLPMSAFAELWGVPFMMKTYGIDSAEASIGTMMVFLGVAVGSVLGPIVSNLIESHLKVMRWSAISTFGLFVFIIFGPSISLTMMHALLFVTGLACGGQILYFAAARQLAPSHLSATSIGFTNGVVMSSGLFFQPLLGILLDYAWKVSDAQVDAALTPIYTVADYKFAFGAVLGALLLAIVLLIPLKETFSYES